MSQKSRVARLEALRVGSGGFELVGLGLYDATEGELSKLEAEARERVGPDGRVVVFQYVDDWNSQGVGNVSGKAG